MMTYLKTAWAHNNPQNPVEILSELDAERYEMRKIERFRDGSVRLVGPEGTPGDDYLAERPFPSEETINAQPRLRLLPTSKEEFEQLWQAAAVSTAA